MSAFTVVFLVAWFVQMPLLIGLLIGRAWGYAGVAIALMAAELYAVCGG